LKSIDACVVIKAGQRFPFPLGRRAKRFLARSSRERDNSPRPRQRGRGLPQDPRPRPFSAPLGGRAAPCPYVCQAAPTCAISGPNWENCACRQRIELVNSASSERVMESIAIGDSLSGPKSGTARMSESPNSGVVNADGRVHRLENLYVAGCATSPTSGQATPMLAVVI
jgi:hypothetical protein